MDPMAATIKSLGSPDVTPELKRKITEAVLQEAGNHSVEQLARKENELLVGLLKLRSTAAQPANTSTSQFTRLERRVRTKERNSRQPKETFK